MSFASRFPELSLLASWLLTGGALLAGGCTGESVPIAQTDEERPHVRFQLVPEDLNALPFPNDVLTVPDPESPSGLRPNLSLQADSEIETELRRALNGLDGWGVFAPIGVSFEPSAGRDPGEPAVDLENINGRQIEDGYDFTNDALYLVNLSTGLPVPLALSPGSFQYVTLLRTWPLPTSPRSHEPTLEVETVDERADSSEVRYETALDTDFDGWLDRPNILGVDCGAPAAAADHASIVRDTCLLDNLAPWYERETDRLIVRPVVPLAELTRYAVVLTDRLVDEDGTPVATPFATIYHPSQQDTARRVREILANDRDTHWWGDIAGTGLDHVTFLWSFTTGAPTQALSLVHDGLEGAGPLAALAARFPPELHPARVVGRLTEEELARGEIPPDNWEQGSACTGLVDRPFQLDAAELAERIGSRSPEDLDLTEREQRAIVESLRHLDHIVIGSVPSPFLLADGPESPALTTTFDLDRDPESVPVPVWLFVPRSEPDLYEQPFDVALYAPSTEGSVVEALPLAGHLAAQGLATAAYDAPWQGPDASARRLVAALLDDGCYRRGEDAAMATRAVDIDGDGQVDDDLGAPATTGRIPHARDVIRQSVVDAFSILRALRTWDGRPAMDLDDDGRADPAGDFDLDGVPDLGGPAALYGAWGQSLGAQVVSLLGPLEPQVAAIAPVGGAGTLVDARLRTGSSSTQARFLGPWLGPAILITPVTDLEDPSDCAPTQSSVRLVAQHGRAWGEQRLTCLEPPAGYPTVIVDNLTRELSRCGRLTDGSLYLPFPAQRGDTWRLRLFQSADAVDTYSPRENCRVAAGNEPVVTLGPFTSPTSGAGLHRQTPELRRRLDLGRHVAGPADPVAYARLFAQAPPAFASGAPGLPTGALLVVPTGSSEVPVDVQVTTARALGLVPFLPPEAADESALVEYATPDRLFESLGGVTPDRLLIASSVLEGLAALERTVPAGECAANELSADQAPECHRLCVATSECNAGQECNLELGICRTPPPDEETCRQALFDIDVLDEGRTRYGEQQATEPLRLARIAGPVATDLDSAWEPRLAGTPLGPDEGAWAADRRTLAIVFPTLAPTGQDRIAAPDPCAAFSVDRYVTNLVARFLATGGLDPYHVSHPATHHCLENETCPFIVP